MEDAIQKLAALQGGTGSGSSADRDEEREERCRDRDRRRDERDERHGKMLASLESSNSRIARRLDQWDRGGAVAFKNDPDSPIATTVVT